MIFGYIDPGAGTIILQTVIAAVLGVVIFFRDNVKRVFLYLFGKRNPKPDEGEDDSTAKES